MIKKIIYLLLTLFLVSCGSSRNKKVPVYKKKPAVTISTKNKPATSSTNPYEKKTTSTNNESLEATSRVMTNAETIMLYVTTFKDVAMQNMQQYGIPASITLAQGILESGAGRGRLSKEANNHFGIKCHKEWSGPSIKHDDDASQECFRKYNDPAESYKDHSLFLTSRSRYSKLFDLDKGDFEGWAKGLKNAGYATDPKYPSKLIGIIERYELNKYDDEVLNRKEKKHDDNAFVSVSNDNAVSESFYVIQQGDTLYSLSKKYNISVEDLKKVNGLRDNALSIGQKIKLK